MNNAILNKYPCLDMEVLVLEVELRKYYENVVAYIPEAISTNLHYGKVLGNEKLASVFYEYESRYLAFLEAFIAKHKVYHFENGTVTQFLNWEALRTVSIGGLRESKLYLNKILLIPEKNLLIVFGHDLKLILFWEKSIKLDNTVLQLLQENQISYE